MTLKYFQRLAESNQYKQLLLKGVCIAERQSGDQLLILFQLHHFYVEIAFGRNSDELLMLRSFEDTAELDLYLKGIDLKPLQYR